MENNVNNHYIIPFEREVYNNRNKAMEIVKCIMEILHNAVDADAKHIIIKILSDTDDMPVKLIIYNDGKEIEKEKIDKILINGYSTREKDEQNKQGKFGVGAALASQNISNKTTITCKDKENYIDCVSDYIDMIEKNTNIPYIKHAESKNIETYKSLGDKGVLFTFESLTQIVTNYTQEDLESRLERCIKTTFLDLGKKFIIKINDNVINNCFDIIEKYGDINNSIQIPIYHYKHCREYISIFDEKNIGKKESNFITYMGSKNGRTTLSKDVLDTDRKYKYCGKSLAIGCRISMEQVKEEIDFWKSCSYYEDIKYNNLTGASFIRNNVCLNQNMERLPWDNKDYGDDQIRWKLEWNNNEDLDKIYGIQTVKIIQEDTKHNCDPNFRWTLKQLKSRGKSYINMLLNKVKIPTINQSNDNIDLDDQDIYLENNIESEYSDSESQIKIKKKRKDFSKNVIKTVLDKTENRCMITGTKVASHGTAGAMREDDHYDGNSSNNNLENLHIITVWAHKAKTRDQNNIIYYQNKGKKELARESNRSFEYNMLEGYQIQHIKEVEYLLESLSSRYLDINGITKDYNKHTDKIIDLYINSLEKHKPEIKNQVFKFMLSSVIMSPSGKQNLSENLSNIFGNKNSAINILQDCINYLSFDS